MSASKDVSEKFRIDIFRNGKLSAILEKVSSEDVLKVSKQLKEAEEKGGRTDSVVEFMKEKTEKTK